jgi:thymidylate kinase
MMPAQIAATYRVIAVEGADGTGKTTLVNQLQTEHSFTVIHNPRTPDGVDLAARYRQILDMPGPLALDRCFVSELVYGPLYHGRSRLTWDGVLDLTHTLTTRQGVFVHLTATAETVGQRLRAREGTSPDPDTVDRLLTAYERTFTALAAHAPVIRIDTTRPFPICG